LKFKKNTSMVTAVATLIVLASTSLDAVNLVSNGDFSSNAASYVTWPGYTGGGGNPAAIDNWTKSGVGGAGLNGTGTTFAGAPFAPSATTGVNTFAFLQNGSPNALSQAIALQANTKYKITWDAGSRAGNTITLGRVQIGDNSNVLFSSGNTTWSSTDFNTYTGTFKTGASFDGSPTVQLYNLSVGGDKTVDYSNIVIEKTTDVVLPTVTNANFETLANEFVTFPGYVSGGGNPAEISGWTGTGARGINPGAGAGAPFRDNGNNATNVAFIQQAGSLSQTIDRFEVGKEYRVAFDYNSRNAGLDNGVNATIGSASFTDAVAPAVGGANSYYAGNLVFNAANATETLTFNASNNAGDDTLLLDNVRIFRNGPSIANNGFEAPGFTNNQFKYQFQMTAAEVTAATWTMAGGSGISHNISAFQGNSGDRAPEGEQLAFFQGAGSSFSQMITGFDMGADYELSLMAMARALGGGNDLEVLLDAGLATEIVLLDIGEVTNVSFEEMVSGAFTADRQSYMLTVRTSLNGGQLSGDRTTFVDNIWFNQLTEVIPEPATATLAMLGLGGLLMRRRREA
jgi:hypothetical protein